MNENVSNIFKRISLLFSLAVCIGASASALGADTSSQALAEHPPNILIITADNLGYGDLRCYNSASPIKTPVLDQLARDGMRLTDFYTASPTCTVSRACLLTGRIPGRHRLTRQLAGVQGNYGVGLRPSERLIPQMLKRSATPYVSGCFGKWNIGFAPGSRPTERGFDEFVGHASGNMDYYHHSYNGKHDLYRGTKELHADGEYATDLFAKAAIEFIQRRSQAKQPWFCYVPFNAPHFPNAKNKQPGQANVWQAPDWALAAYGLNPNEPDPKKRYDAVVTALDAAIGRILKSLEVAGVASNTFVFFHSDNGAFRLGRAGLDVGINEPLRAGGVTCWEGGLRVPAIARWPNKIPAGGTTAEPLWTPDLFIGCAHLARVELSASVKLDGRNPLPVLTAGASSPHESLYFEFREHSALRMDDWKILRERANEPWQLFNLINDQSEQRDVASLHNRRVIEMQAVVQRWQGSLDNQ